MSTSNGVTYFSAVLFVSHITQELRLSKTRSLEVLHDNQLQPYHYMQIASMFPDDCSLGMQFCKWLWHKNTADEIFLQNILLEDDTCFMHEDEFNVHGSQLWTCDNIHAICKRGINFASLNFSAEIVGDIAVGPYPVPSRLTAGRCRDFPKTVLLGCL
jgi:hypothetical protein